jgi:hypothetical protein
MAPFYPYTPLTTNTTTPCEHNTTLHAVVATQIPTVRIASQNADGTSVSAASVVGILAGVLFLFSGVAWFVYHALVVLPVRKKVRVKEVRGRRGGG